MITVVMGIGEHLRKKTLRLTSLLLSVKIGMRVCTVTVIAMNSRRKAWFMNCSPASFVHRADGTTHRIANTLCVTVVNVFLCETCVALHATVHLSLPLGATLRLCVPARFRASAVFLCVGRRRSTPQLQRSIIGSTSEIFEEFVGGTPLQFHSTLLCSVVQHVKIECVRSCRRSGRCPRARARERHPL